MPHCKVHQAFVAALVLSQSWCVSPSAFAQDGGEPRTGGDRRPNIIFLLADDLGFGDVGCYGQTQIRTPQLDRLAEQGLRFTQHYAGSTVCAPSRCCLLTGRHTGHARIRGNNDILLKPDDETVAEILRSGGYQTACIGKWGVGHPPPPGDPRQNGFDFFFGYLDMQHAHNYYPDFLWRNEAKCAIQGNVVKTVGPGGVALKRNQYSHHLFVDEALTYITENQARPFFLYLAFTIPHANNEAGDKGMEVPDDEPYSHMRWPQPQKNHAAMISRLDNSIGRIVGLLERLKIDDRTLVLFSSDNGPHKEGGADPEFFNSSGGLRGYKRSLYEGGIRVPLIAWWPGTIEPGTVSNHVCAFWDFLPTAAELAGVAVPEGIDGISYLPTLTGRSDEQTLHEYLYWEFHERVSEQAVRLGDWKAVRHAGELLELYNLPRDVAEKTNVAADNPNIVEQISFYFDDARVDSPDYPLRPADGPKP